MYLTEMLLGYSEMINVEGRRHFLYQIDWIKLFVFNTKINADKEKKEPISNQKYHSVLVVLDYLI